MADSEHSEGAPGPSRDPLLEQAAALREFEAAIQSARAQLGEYVAAWIADLTSARAGQPQHIDERGRKRLAEAEERLERLGEALRKGPANLEASVPAISAPRAGEPADRDVLDEERRVAERELKEIQARFESAFDSAPIGMALVGMDGRWLQVNDALCRITGYTRNELRATTLRDITHPDDVDRDEDSLRDLLDGRVPSYQTERRYLHAWGHYLWVLLTVSLVRDHRGEPLYVISQVQDISERKETAARQEFLLDHDFLTGLYNRRRFERELSREVERASRYGAHGAALMIDLDNFKEVNDTFGHHAGDDLLKGIAGALRHRMRHTDVLARVGGDEFAAVLPETDADQAKIVADEIVNTLRQQVAVLGDQSIRVTASVGVALFDNLSAVEVLAFADLSMFEAKQAGRNRVAMCRPGGRHPENLSVRLAEADSIRHAVEEGRLLLYGQPILDLRRNEVTQYELLSRLRTADGREPLEPSSFLYVAERFGLIQEIDGWVVRQAIALIAEQARAGRRLVLHVNLSGKSIGDAKVAALTERAIADAGIDPGCLVFELTETTAIANIEEARSFAHRLHDLGCRLALDDFGAGFGSFHYIKSLPFDYFKIDGDFIRGIVASPMDQLVVGAIVGIAKGTGKETIAEFVADGEGAHFLERIGVDYAQGYHVGRPGPVRDILPPA